MKTVNRFYLGLIGIGLLLSAGCVKIWQDRLDIKTYVIEASRDSESLDKPLADKLWIDSVVVLPPYNVRNFILKENDVRYSTSYYTELLMSPSENFQNIVYTWFAESGIFSNVTLDDRTGMSHRLVITMMKFHGDEVENKVVLKMKTTLFDEKTKGVRVLFSNDYIRQVKLVDTSADELVRAYNTAMAGIMAACEKDTVNALK